MKDKFNKKNCQVDIQYLLDKWMDKRSKDFLANHPKTQLTPDELRIRLEWATKRIWKNVWRVLFTGNQAILYFNRKTKGWIRIGLDMRDLAYKSELFKNRPKKWQKSKNNSQHKPKDSTYFKNL